MSRNTVGKSKILEIIQSSPIALSHATIQEQMKGTCDRVTIYRILERLVKENEIHRIVNVNGVVNFAACKSCSHSSHHHDHLHFSCTTCGELTCFEDQSVDLKLPSNFIIQEYQLTVAGLCGKCS
jgi:Fur family ferric uptake transcriptional regulator